MATGRVDFFRRRESPKYPRRDSNEYYRSGDGGDLRHGGEVGARCRDDRGPRRAVENGRREVEVVPEKKRKFSPIIWDKDEKKARMLKICGAVPASSPRKRSSSEVRDVVSNESVVQLLPEKMKSPLAVKEEKKVRITSKNRVVKVEAVLSPRLAQNNAVTLVSATTQIHSRRVETSLSPTGQIQSLGVNTSVSATAQIQSVGVDLSACEATYVDGLVEISQTEAPAEVHTPRPKSDPYENDQSRAPVSRWATYMDSPSEGSCDSTPESGEIRREDSVRSKSRTSSSVGATNSIGGEDIDGVDQEVDAGGDQLYPDSEEDDAALPQIEDTPVPRGRSTNMLNGCRSVAEFAKLDGMLGEGTYGVVYKARDKQTGEIVAIKKVKMDKSSEGGFPITSLREMNILLACNHPSIVDVKEVVHNGDDIFMVMECMDYELKLLTEASKQPFSIGEVKYLVKSLLEGVKYLHDNWVLHRDLKTSNLLMNKGGELKICDFGLSRLYGSPLKQYTSEVVTLWYRAPELLLGQKKYSTAIDMWSVGCIMAELLAREALFPGKSEVEQLDKIFKTLGTPTETDWPGVSKLPGFAAIKVKQRENLLRKKFAGTCFTGAPMLSSSGLDMLTKLLTFDPAQRISADDALKHDWFKDYPEPRPFKPSSTVHDRYMALRQRQEREHLARARRGKC